MDLKPGKGKEAGDRWLCPKFRVTHTNLLCWFSVEGEFDVKELEELVVKETSIAFLHGIQLEGPKGLNGCVTLNVMRYSFLNELDVVIL